MTKEYSPAWPHGSIEKAFEGIYVVRGTNITFFQEQKIQHSRNMTIVESDGELILINTVRLNEAGLASLDKLGRVRHIISIGAFHGRDDAFYQDHYNAELWTVKPITENDCSTVHCLNSKEKLPVPKGKYIPFETASPEEGYLFIDAQGGIIISCDSIKNWVEIDEFFSKETAEIAQVLGEITKARISPIWLNSTAVKKEDFEKLLSLKFKHLISAHGDVLKDTAHEDIAMSVQKLSK